MKRFQQIVGEEPTESVYLDIIAQINQFYVTCGTAHEAYKSELKMKFEEEPETQSRKAVGGYERIKKALSELDKISLLRFFAGKPIEELDSIITNLDTIEKFAGMLEEKHKNLIGGAGQMVDPLLIEAALSKLEALRDKIEGLEVAE